MSTRGQRVLSHVTAILHEWHEAANNDEREEIAKHVALLANGGAQLVLADLAARDLEETKR